VLLLSVHDERTVAEGALAAGADAVVLKRCLATELMPAIDAVLAGRRYLSPGASQ
jgi:DNA-binding NarL/FixJ family response regulator